MIRTIEMRDLPDCLDIFHKGYETVAVEFGLTDENCPDRGRASLPMEKLVSEFDSGTKMFGYFSDDKLVGFLGMKIKEEFLKLDDIIIHPEYRGRGYGKELLDFCKLKANEFGKSTIELGMIDDNTRLKKWYENNGFINIGHKKYENAPFTVGRMRYTL
ncbi:MAG: GNAT family N-acetyltransferase [Lachnospiraceae bacterium]|nr:GNAT family N-acetyltransferase [Lachnospiraceae bacterium]